MTNFTPRVTTIKGLSDKRRLPRLGIIRLGMKLKSKKTGKEYPAETAHFVVPEEVMKVYGSEPTELDVMLPLNELEAIFPCAYKYYGSSRGLICTGDGEVAYRVNPDTREMQPVKCPCELLEQKKCTQGGTLNVILYKINVGGVYQIRTGSYHSIIDINSGIDYVQALVGRVAMVPLKLKREKTETHHDEKKQTHYTLRLILDADINCINELRKDNTRILEQSRHIALPVPKEENPEMDAVDVFVDEEEAQPAETPENGASKDKDVPDIVEPDASSQAEIEPKPEKMGITVYQPKPGYEKGMAIKCPDIDHRVRPKTDCGKCAKRDDGKSICPAWEMLNVVRGGC